MKKIILSAALTIVFAGYAVFQRTMAPDTQGVYIAPKNGSSQSMPEIVPVNSGGSPIAQTSIPASRGRGGDNFEDDEDDSSVPLAPNTKKTTTVSVSTVPSPAPVTTVTPAVTAPAVNNGLYKNGQYTGPVADAYYGNVQVKVIISGGKITDVQFLDHPQSRSNSVRINNYAMPILTSQAIEVQNANVDGVSGATHTSGAFRQSLGEALAQAKN